MFKVIITILITSLSLLFISCSSVSVSTDYDTSIDFSNYQTYEISKDPIKGSELENAALVKKRVLEAIKKTMNSKGFLFDDSGNADLVVYTHAGTSEKMNASDWGYSYGAWWGSYPYGRNIDVSYYTEGSLFIDIVDNVKDELIWRGIGSAVVKDRGTPEERQEFINSAVAKILTDFPPGKSE
ncbi:MAG: DUF4136 domain-containing protein [Ignavibacteriaceae bacterium]